MKITGIEFKRRIAPADSGHAAAEPCVVRLQTDTGLTGIGLTVADVGTAIDKLGSELLVGEDPRAIAALHTLMCESTRERRRNRKTAMAIAALDIALWDLRSKINDEPLWKTLGAAMHGSMAHACHTDPTSSAAEVAAWFGQRVDAHGLSAGSLALGDDPAMNHERVAAMRDALTRSSVSPLLMLVPAPDWPTATIIEHVQQLETAFDVTCVQAVADAREADEWQYLSENVYAAVRGGRQIYRVADHKPAFVAQAFDIVEIDIACTGISGAMQIADAAFGHELPVVLQDGSGSVAAHLAPALPYFMSLEIPDAEDASGFEGPGVDIRGGRAFAGDRPGTGILVSAAGGDAR